MEFNLLLLLCGLSLVIIVLLVLFRPRPNNNLFKLSMKMDELFASLDKISQHLKTDLRAAREESAALARDNRAELNDTLRHFKGEVTETLRLITESNRAAAASISRTLEERIAALVQQVETAHAENRKALAQSLKDFTLEQRARTDDGRREQAEAAQRLVAQLDRMTARMEERLTAVHDQAKADADLQRQALETSFKGFKENFNQGVDSINGLQREKFANLEARQSELVQKTEVKLEEMRATVDEKLQKTLNERLGQSFELVGKQLERVQQGLGEMQHLAQDVGGLKKVLSNVKMRGGFGEVQLQMLLENILAPDQYAANVQTKKGSGDHVEFAVKLPNPDGAQPWIWLPIDAKFPRDAYELLQSAYEAGDAPAVEAAQKALESAIRKMARDICDKYIDPPGTTGFAVMFLPFEGIYAEVVRKAALLEEIQRDCGIMIAGPSTLWAYLHSLQMGFRTLAIQKRTSEVWTVLGDVKKEFRKFGGLLEKAQKNLHTASHTLDEVMGKRTKAIERKLRDVEVLDEAQELLPEGLPGQEEEGLYQ